MDGMTGATTDAKTMRVILAQPRGFCAGVERAIDIVERALVKFGPPHLCPPRNRA